MKELKKERAKLLQECHDKNIKITRSGKTVKQQITYLKDKLSTKPAEPAK